MKLRRDDDYYYRARPAALPPSRFRLILWKGYILWQRLMEAIRG